MRKVLVLVVLAIFSLSAEILVSDDFESGTGNWTLTGNWGLEEGTSVSGTHFLTESPTGNYTANEVSSAVWKNPVDLSTYYDANVSFWIKFNIEEDFDYMFFEVSDDNGAYWRRLKTWTGEVSDWQKETVSLALYAGHSNVTFRFLFDSDPGLEADGMHIDDFIIEAGVFPNTGPYIYFWDAPVNYEGALNEFKSGAEVYDPDGVDSVWVEYSVDFSDTIFKVIALNTLENLWEFTIPNYGPGSQIDFRICAQDASDEHMTSSTSEYSYISGDYKIYDSGTISYYKLIENDQAMAVRITPHIYAQTGLVFALIRNYMDLDHISADMKFHVWTDNDGVPGEDMIIPITVTPEAYLENNCAFTRVDLRSYYLPMTEDFWIGVSAFEGNVYSLIEAPYEEGTTAYERSCSGSWSGTEWIWFQDTDYNYHFRAIMSEPEGIEENPILPSSTELHQNYPNPFNPSTVIGYSLKSEGMVILSVFNTKGELVRTLVNEKKTAGNHSVNFNGEGLNSGIYFYKLDVNGSNVDSKRMLLIK